MVGPGASTGLAPRQASAILRAARLAFLAAQAVVLWGVFSKGGGQVQILPWDKAEHFVAFLGLMLVALLAFPARSPAVLALALALEGGLIEIIQATPMVQRDADLKDWAADLAGVLTVIAALTAGRVRLRLRPKSEPGPRSVLPYQRGAGADERRIRRARRSGL